MEDTSGFYKYQEEIEVMYYGPNFVYGPYDTFRLFREEHNTYTYPVDGWYWFDTLDEAMTFFSNNKESVTSFQIYSSLIHHNLYDQVQNIIQQSDMLTKLYWNKATEFTKDSAEVLNVINQLNLSEQDINNIFDEVEHDVG